VPFDDALRARYRKTNGTAFAGMVSGPNNLMRRIAKRDLITWVRQRWATASIRPTQRSS